MVAVVTDFVHRLTSHTSNNVKKLLCTLLSKMATLNIKPVRFTGWFQERVAYETISFLIYQIKSITAKLNI